MTGPPLRSESNSAVAMVFGMAIRTPDASLPTGLLCTCYDELAARGLLPELLGLLDPDLSATITLRVGVDRSRFRRQTTAR